MNIMMSSGYNVPEWVRYGFYLASQALPYGLIAVIAALPFCFAARRTGYIGLAPLLILALAAVFSLLSLWTLTLVAPALQASSINLIGSSFLYVLLLFFLLFDHLFELGDDFILLVADDLAGPRQCQSPPHVFHHPRDFVQRIGL